MIFCIGIYEVEFENNVIQIPRAWRKRINKADSLYCKLDEYVSKDDENHQFRCATAGPRTVPK